MTEIAMQKVEAIQHLNGLKRMRNASGLLEAAYDWLSMEIAQMEREIFGRELS